MLEVKVLDKNRLSDIAIFLRECKGSGLDNNSSLKAIKFDRMDKLSGQIWLCYLGGKVISMAGAHKLDEVGKGSYRLLFRGATLPEYRGYFKVLNKFHMNSIPFSVIMPFSMVWAREQGAKDFVITTNVDFGKHGTSNTHRLMQTLEKRGLVSWMREEKLYNVIQGVWRLNVDEYKKRHKAFSSRNQLPVPDLFYD